ncbi:MAG TPA: hypothetical protein VF258_04830, partial [Luteolibacter sp.]
LAILDTATRLWIPDLQTTPVASVAKGFVVASLPGLIWLWPEALKLLPTVGITWICMWLSTLLYRKIHASYRGHVTGLWILKGLLALAASAPALLHR